MGRVLDSNVLSRRPLVTELCRVERLYTGGALLDRWQGIAARPDGTMSEEFLISTVEYLGPGSPPEQGISLVGLANGELGNLRSLINLDRSAFLGTQYADSTYGHSGVLIRVGDSAVRLVIQCHPTQAKANEVLGLPFGKTEAWYIADTRVINDEHPHFYCGFKPGMTRSVWRDLLKRQDTQGMLNSLYRFEVRKGDCILIPSGMPHAMGTGCLFIEVHEPCDYTIRMEKNYQTRTLSDEEMHYGLGFEALLDFFEYDTYSFEEIRKKCIMEPMLLSETGGGRLFQLINYDNTDRFAVDLLHVDGRFPLPDRSSHFLLVGVKSDLELTWAGGSCVLPQGRGAFVPASTRGLSVFGRGEMLLAYPFRVA